MFMNKKLPLVVSMGEPAGIGPDIILLSWIKRVALSLPFFYVIGNKACLQERARQLGLDVSIETINHSEQVSDVFSNALPVMEGVPLDLVVAGEINPAHGGFVIDAIKSGVQAIHNHEASGLVTAPIHKGALYDVGFSFPGHTEYLAALSSEIYGLEVHPVMMLACDRLRVVPVTIHVALSDVPGLLTQELIVRTVGVVARDLSKRWRLESPRIILTGLNPHAGEDGAMGREEIDVIEPAIEILKRQGLDVTGPYPGDTCFHEKARAGYDCAVCMYHDQALIPVKTLGFDEGVNITLGLPFIRTSPDHGTALAIAGKGTSDPSSFIEAVRTAQIMADNQLSDVQTYAK